MVILVSIIIAGALLAIKIHQSHKPLNKPPHLTISQLTEAFGGDIEIFWEQCLSASEMSTAEVRADPARALIGAYAIVGSRMIRDMSIKHLLEYGWFRVEGELLAESRFWGRLVEKGVLKKDIQYTRYGVPGITYTWEKF